MKSLMRALPALVLSLTVALVAPACSGAADTGTKDNASKAETEAKKQRGRSYDNPDAALSKAEKADILAICDAITEADRKRMSPSEEKSLYGSLKGQSDWGKLMIKHLKAEGRKKAGHRVARLLKHEDMKWASGSCRTVIKKYSHYQ